MAVRRQPMTAQVRDVTSHVTTHATSDLIHDTTIRRPVSLRRLRLATFLEDSTWNSKGKDKGQVFDMALITQVRLVTCRSALQSQKWQLIGMS